MSKETSRDYLKKADYPKQTYALSGMDWADSSIGRTRGKLDIFGSPMVITPVPPGVFAHDDEVWQQTYGASADAMFSLFKGSDLIASITTANTNLLAGIYKDSLFHAENSNLYYTINGQQQIQYVVSKDTVADAKQATQFGAIGEARSLSLRGPMHLAGWGKTITLRPTDPDPIGRDNDNSHKLDRSTWKHGPIDVRWDGVRGCWRTWNDLVADQNGKGLGTFVFGTNTDTTDGFPYIRGKLEDVWAVRRTHQQEGTPMTAVKTSDSAKSAEILTIVEHRLLDGNNAGPLSDVFSVNGSKGPGVSFVAGSETTRDSLLTILTTAEFNDENGHSGAISFNATTPTTVTLGDLYWDGALWRPGFTEETLSICALASEQFSILLGNDVANADAIQEVGIESFDWLEILDGIIQNDIVSNFESTADGFSNTQAYINNKIVAYINDEVLPAIEVETEFLVAETAINVLSSVQGALTTYGENVQSAIQAAFVAIVTSLSENCGCVIAIPEISIPAPTISPIFVNEMHLDVELDEISLSTQITEIHDGDFNIFLELFNHPNAPQLSWDILEPCESGEFNYDI